MTNPNIKFFRCNPWPSTVTPQEGYIWFNTVDRTISLYKNGAWEKYTGKINDITYANGKLTITPNEGDAFEIDLSAVGNIADLSNRLSTLETNFNTFSEEFAIEKGKISTLQGEMSDVKTEVAKLSDVTGKVGAYVVEKISAHEAAREIIDSDFNQRIGSLETTTDAHTSEIGGLKNLVGTTAVATQITNAINGLGAEKTGNGTFVDVTVKQENGEITSVTVDESDIASATTLNNLATTVNNNKTDLENKINTEKDRIDALIGTGEGSIRDIAIDVLTETLVDENAADAYDTLQEMSAWIKNHPGEVTTMNKLLSQHTTAIATLNGDTQTAGSVSKAVADVKAALEGTFKSGETSKTLAAINADVDALETRINNLDATVKDESDYIRGSVTQTDGKLTSVSFTATTGSVANNADALAVASDVKSYVDGM